MSKKFLNKSELIEKIVTLVDVTTPCEACKNAMRIKLAKLPIKELKPMADALEG